MMAGQNVSYVRIGRCPDLLVIHLCSPNGHNVVMDGSPASNVEAQAHLTAIRAALPTDVTFAATLRHNGHTLAETNAHLTLPTASIGKVFILTALALAVVDGTESLTTRLDLRDHNSVGDSGLLQYMREDELSLGTLAVLVGSVSDNDAANALLDHLGLDRVQEISALLGIPHTRLEDRIRLERTTAHPPSPSQARTADLATFMDLTATGRLFNADVSTLVAEWLATGTDLSMAAAPLGLDPLAHRTPTSPQPFFNKSGTDAGVYADCGAMVGPTDRLTYAAIANWDPSRDDLRLPALAAMRQFGELLVRFSPWG